MAWTEPSSLATEQCCIVFNLFEHNPYLDLTYALLKAVGGHHQWRWTEPSSLAAEQFCIVFNLFEHNSYLDLTYALLKAVGGHHQWRWDGAFIPWLLNSFV